MENFTEDIRFSLEDGIKKKNYQILMRHFNVKKFDAIEQELKKDKNDLNVELTSGLKLKIEFKNRREGSNSNLIALEVYSNNDKKVKGWTFKLKENGIDYVIVTWHGKKKECYLILKAKELEEWWLNSFKNYEIILNKMSYYQGYRWQSSFCYVPIKDIPKDIIYAHQQYIDLTNFWSQNGKS